MSDAPRLTIGRVTITVQVTERFPTGSADVPAVILGPLAVTPCQSPAGGWVITHISTRKKLSTDDNGRFEVRASAIAAMRELIAFDPDWDVAMWWRERLHLRADYTRLVGEILRRHGGTTIHAGSDTP